LQGIEANIDAAGGLDLSEDEAATFDVVLAAPHSRLRRNEDQTDRMLSRGALGKSAHKRVKPREGKFHEGGRKLLN